MRSDPADPKELSQSTQSTNAEERLAATVSPHDEPAESPNSGASVTTKKPPTTPRIRREQRTMAAMIAMYCAAGHPQSGAGRLAGDTAIDSRSAAAQEATSSAGVQLCSQCQRLLNYSDERLERCPFRQDKPTCRVCPIHCYAPRQRQQAKAVMRYAGPRMLLRHPLLALGHLGDEVLSALRRPSGR